MTIEEEGLENAAPVDLSETGDFFSQIRERVGPDVGVGLKLRCNPKNMESPIHLQLSWMGSFHPKIYNSQSPDWRTGLREAYAYATEEDPEAQKLWVPESVAALSEMFDSLLSAARVMTGKETPRASLQARYWARWEACRDPGQYTATIIIDDVIAEYRYRDDESLVRNLVGSSSRIIENVFSEVQHFYEERTALLRKVA